MNFKSNDTEEVKDRLERGNRQKFTREELRQFAGHVQFLEPKHINRYFAELFVALGDDLVSLGKVLDENRDAIGAFNASARTSMQEVRGTIGAFDASTRASLNEVRSTIKKFDESSSRLTRWLLGLTIVLVVLTGVIAWFTILLLRRG